MGNKIWSNLEPNPTENLWKGLIGLNSTVILRRSFKKLETADYFLIVKSDLAEFSPTQLRDRCNFFFL